MNINFNFNINSSLLNGSSSNNPYVQLWLNRVNALTYTSPNNDIISDLNQLLKSIDSLMDSDALSLKIYGLGDNTLGQAATVNFVNPSQKQSVLISSPAYSALGYTSNGTSSYIKGGVFVNDFTDALNNGTIIFDVISANTTPSTSLRILGGGISGRNILCDPFYATGPNRIFSEFSGGGAFWTAKPSTGWNGFYSFGRSASSAQMKVSEGATTATLTSASAAIASNIEIAELAALNNTSPSGYFNAGSLSMIFYSKRAWNSADVALFKTAWETFKTARGI